MIVALDGTDGSGKTTIAKEIARRMGRPYLHFPYYENETGKLILDYLNKQVPWNGLAFQCLQVCNRIQELNKLMRCNRDVSRHIILDRYNASTIVYGRLFDVDEKLTTKLCSVLPQADIEIIITSDKPFRLNEDVHETQDNWIRTKEYFKDYAEKAKIKKRKIAVIENNATIDDCIGACERFIQSNLDGR